MHNSVNILGKNNKCNFKRVKNNCLEKNVLGIVTRVIEEQVRWRSKTDCEILSVREKRN